MGLDMYLTGERYFRKDDRKRGDKKAELIDLGYWCKHPNLHGYIVDAFADDDDGKPIQLESDKIRQVIAAILNEDLPHTEGSCFGESDGSEKSEDLTIFREALFWLESGEPDIFKSVYYQASW